MDIPGNTPHPPNFNWFQFNPPPDALFSLNSPYYICLYIGLNVLYLAAWCERSLYTSFTLTTVDS